MGGLRGLVGYFLVCIHISIISAQCPWYVEYAQEYHEPFTDGRYNLSSQRPIEFCRTATVPEVEDEILRLKGVIKDPDLYRLFENAFPNTLDTTIRWRGFAGVNDTSSNTSSNTISTTTDSSDSYKRDENGSDEELTYIITGDINAMWLRDSANQLLSYLPLLKANSSTDSLAGLFRGAINLQARYIIEAPYCNAFQAPDESGIKRYNNVGTDEVTPYYDPLKVFSCDYELDSLASFLQLSTSYAEATDDYAFFEKYSWIKAVHALMTVALDMRTPTYAKNGSVLDSPFTFSVLSRFGGAPINQGKGSPIKDGTGLVRSFFRPSDDACIYQLFIPGNMMFSRFLSSAAKIMERMPKQNQIASTMREMAKTIRRGIERHGVIRDGTYGDIYAYEVDGFGSANMMDDANVPSLLAAPVYGFLNKTDQIYKNTRRRILSEDNPYFARGPVINAVGGPHDGPGKAWPMSSIMRILTTDDDEEIVTTLREILSSTDGFGLIHESIDSFNDRQWTRQWFAWANGLFGQMILDLEKRKPHILAKSFQH